MMDSDTASSTEAADKPQCTCMCAVDGFARSESRRALRPDAGSGAYACACVRGERRHAAIRAAKSTRACFGAAAALPGRAGPRQ